MAQAKLCKSFYSGSNPLGTSSMPRNLPRQFFECMFSKYSHIIGVFACIAIIGACFMPWCHYNNINETFTGYHVTRFSTGNYYGKAGKIITVFSLLVLILMMIKKVWAKRINLFMAASLFAYTIRTYIIFTSALFEGEVEKKAGIYLIVILSTVIMVSAAFPKLDLKSD